MYFSFLPLWFRFLEEVPVCKPNQSNLVLFITNKVPCYRTRWRINTFFILIYAKNAATKLYKLKTLRNNYSPNGLSVNDGLILIRARQTKKCAFILYTRSVPYTNKTKTPHSTPWRWSLVFSRFLTYFIPFYPKLDSHLGLKLGFGGHVTEFDSNYQVRDLISLILRLLTVCKQQAG